MCKVCVCCVRLQTCVQLRQGDWGGENLGQGGPGSLGLKPTEGKEMGTPSCPHNPRVLEQKPTFNLTPVGDPPLCDFLPTHLGLSSSGW